MAEYKPQFSMSAEPDTSFDRLVCLVAEQLETGEEVDFAELLESHPEHASRLRELLPTLQAMAELRPAKSAVKSSIGRVGSAISGVLGDFRIRREIGRGGMGVVYEAEQISLARRVAVKILPFASVLDPRRMQRFQNEARAAASLHHPNIVPVYFVGSERGVHFYAMQLIQGQSLDEVIREIRRQRQRNATWAVDQASIKESITREAAAPVVPRSDLPSIAKEALPSNSSSESEANQATLPLPLGSTERSKTDVRSSRTVVALMGTVAEAIDHAHQQGIVHRDIKPANLMLDLEGKVWVTDFGLAQVEAGDTLTTSGDLLGTLRYMSPEQASGGQGIVDRRSDVYSLGVTLYELLTLEPAFNSRDRNQLLRDILTLEPRPIRKLDKHLPVELEIIVGKAIAKDPADRYQTAAELAADLMRFLRNVPILARKPTLWQWARKWCQRHVEFVVVAATFAMMFGLAAIGAGWIYWNQATELSGALENARLAAEMAQEAQATAERSRDREMEARKKAAVSAAESQAVLSFLDKQILSAARPEGIGGGQGIEVTLRQAIDQAVPFVEQSFKNQPLIEWKLRRTLGSSYQELAEFKSAQIQFQRAFELSNEHLGPHHINTLGDLVNLGAAEHRLGDLATAKEKLSVAYREIKERYPDHVYLQNCLTSLASLDLSLGQHAAAAEKFEQVWAEKRERLGPKHLETLDAQSNLAMAYKDLGRLDEAEAMLQFVLEVQQDIWGVENPKTWISMSNLATVESQLGKIEASIEKRTTLLKQYSGTLGEDHLTTLGGMVNLAMLYEDQKRFAEAEDLLRKSVPKLRANYSRHDFTLNGMNSLATITGALGKVQESIDLCEDVLQLSIEIRGAEHLFTLGLRVNLANAWHRTGQSQRAIAAYRQVLRVLRKQYPDHLYSEIALRSLAQVQMEVGEFGQSISALKQLLEIRETRWPKDHPRRLETLVRLGHCYRQIGNGDKATAMYAEVLPILRKDFGGTELLSLALSDQGLLHMDRAEFEQAIEYLQESYESRLQELGPTDPKTLGMLVNWGLAEWMLGQPTQAAQRMESALVAFRQGKPTEPFFGVCLKQLSAIYEELGRDEEELKLLHEFEQWLVKQGGDEDPQTYRVRVRLAQRNADWDTARKLVRDFEVRLGDDPSDYCIAAGLRARLWEMAKRRQPEDTDGLESHQQRIKAWLQQAEKDGLAVESECRFDPALRRFLLHSENE